jgi:D-cysteine desulfhydrase
VKAAQELREQLPDLDLVVVATGSGGTHAGLVAGLGDHGRVAGIMTGTVTDEVVDRLAAEVADLAGIDAPKGRCTLDTSQMGRGYGALTTECQEAMQLTARLEGVLLDPVYTGKAMAALVARARAGSIDPNSVVVFMHTGGLPGLLSADSRAWLRPRLATTGV